MPKTTINEHGNLLTRKDEIGTYPLNFAIQTIPDSCVPEEFAYCDFGLQVLLSNSRHLLGTVQEAPSPL